MPNRAVIKIVQNREFLVCQPLGLVSARDALGLEMISFAGEMAQREALAEVL